ncbi:actin-binding protein WASF2-like [Anopheles cruzii]|uniref:actin-binding protein WASF2-like n=1 Tax=Anopheles cruzii TaxID=68878 RepID=UPI0022EC86FB|nr:actin-binding protein WASF2-like [Anopheles cruzii]
MVRIGLVCLAGWTLVVGAVAQCGGGEGIWYTEEPPSVEASMLSFEEASDEYYQVRRHPRHQQQHRSRVRSSRYTPGGYGYGNDYQLERTWEKQPAARQQPLYGDRRKSRRQQGSYASRSQRTDYNYQVAPVTEGAVYERRKANRAAKYSGPDDGPGHKTSTVAYKVLPPKPSCAQNLLIGCTPTVTRVPCSASMHEGYGAAPYYPPVPMSYSYHEPAASYGHPGYEPHPAGYHQHPAGYQKPAATEFHHHPPAGPEGPPPPGYAPSYKSATGEELPGFAAPVREDLSESPKVPIISAFGKPQPDLQQSTTATANEATSSAPQQQQLSRAAPSNGTQPSQEPGPAPHSATPMPAVPGTTQPKEDSNAEFWNDTESSTDAVEATTAS